MITSGLQDYLELIYNSVLQGQAIKAVDIANEFKISRPSVSEALIRLADMDLIVYEGRKGITITKKGIDEAKKIIKKHETLRRFFSEVLGLDNNLASQNACKIEHVIDDIVINELEKFRKFYKDQNIEYKK